jgi:hypothetical protein
MDLSSLPAYPTPEPPAPVTPPSPPGRGKTMLLQALFLLACWSGVYVIHEQAQLIVAAEKKAREREEAELKRAGIGKWESIHGDEAVLELKGSQGSESRFLRGRFTLLRDGEVFLRGEFHHDWFADDYCLEQYISLSHSEFFRYRVKGDVLELELGEGLAKAISKDASDSAIMRFKRLKD